MKRPSFTSSQRLQVFETFGAVVCCQGPGCNNVMQIKGCSIDHHLALIDGGKHELENWRPLCDVCHRPKSAREHKGNSKAKRIAKAQEIHKAVVARVMDRPAGKIKGRGFDKSRTRRFDGKVVARV